MAIFGFGKDKKDNGNGSELVLAYLEDAQRVRAPFTLAGPRKAETPAILQSLDEAEGTATFQITGPLVAEKGNTVELVFIQEGLRLGGSGRLVENRPGVAVLELPEALEIKERRGQPRARLNPKEGATLTALTGLFEGVGITGVIENLSESGVRVRVEKGMSIIMISSELPEVLGMSDRVYIVSSGKIAGELPIGEATQEKIMQLATSY